MQLFKLKQMPKPQDSSKKIDVIGQREIIIPKLEELVRFDIENSDKLYQMKQDGKISWTRLWERQYTELVKASGDLVTQVWGELPSMWRRSLRKFIRKGYKVQHRRLGLEAFNVLKKSKDANLVGCVVYGNHPLEKSIRPTIRDSFVLGYDTISGCDQNFPIEQYTPFLEIEQDLLSRDRERVLKAISKFSKSISDSKYKDISKWLEESPDTRSEYFFLISSLDKNEKYRHCPYEIEDKLIVAAKELDGITSSLDDGDAYHVDIANSVIFGRNALNDVKGGTIKDSIVAGDSPLSRANVKIKNSYVIKRKGTQFIEDEVLGNPEAYQRIPKSVIEPRNSFIEALQYSFGLSRNGPMLEERYWLHWATQRDE